LKKPSHQPTINPETSQNSPEKAPSAVYSLQPSAIFLFSFYTRNRPLTSLSFSFTPATQEKNTPSSSTEADPSQD